jgi:hypothetical protein
MASVTITAGNTDVDWLEVLPADDKPVALRGMVLSQTSEVGDAQEEGLRFRVLRLAATVTSGSGGTTPTPQPLNDADAAAGFTSDANNTTVATTSGATTVLAEFGWNVRNSPYEMWWPDSAFAPLARQGQGLIVRQETTVADDAVCLATFYLEEL